MRAGSPARWYTRFAVVCALGAAALGVGAGPAAAGSWEASASDAGATINDVDWQAPPPGTEAQVLTLDVDWQ